MKAHAPVFTLPLLVVLVCGTLASKPSEAQYDSWGGGNRPDVPWENDRLRISQVAVEPGAVVPSSGNRVLVYFTADASGRVPPEAVWEAAGAGDVHNRGSVRLEALAIELKDGVQGAAPGTPPEAFEAAPGVQVTLLIDNSYVLVAKHRYDPTAAGAPLHFHVEDVLVVYLHGGYIWPWTGDPGAFRVRRGDMDVIPANTLHRLGNAGGDPLELLVIVPK